MCLIAIKMKIISYSRLEHVTERKNMYNVGPSSLPLSTVLEINQESVTVSI